MEPGSRKRRPLGTASSRKTGSKWVCKGLDEFSTIFHGSTSHSFQVVEVEVVEILEPLHEASEAGMTSHWIELDELKDMIMNGVIQDSPSLAALSIFLLRRLKIPK
jgi:hypothetical protein